MEDISNHNNTQNIGAVLVKSVVQFRSLEKLEQRRPLTFWEQIEQIGAALNIIIFGPQAVAMILDAALRTVRDRQSCI